MRDAGWVDEAKCRELDPAVRDGVFFPAPGDSLEPAKAVCRACPVRMQCLEFALATHEQHGVWGGTSAKERARIARARRRGLPDPIERPPRRSAESLDPERSATGSVVRRANAAAVTARLNAGKPRERLSLEQRRQVARDAANKRWLRDRQIPRRNIG